MTRVPSTGAGSLRSYLELARPANVVTALADVLAGSAVALGPDGAIPPDLGWLLLATAALYAGGVVFNDYFDRTLDSTERPERPIPSGRVSAAGAHLFGSILLGLGIAAAGLAGRTPLLLAVAIGGGVLLYDAWGKHRTWFGPVNMGLCRALNLMLGIAIVPAAVGSHWALGFIPLVYIAAVTVISRGEVAGGRRPVALAAFGLVSSVAGGLLWLAIHAVSTRGWALAVALLFIVRVLPPFWTASLDPSPGRIRHAVRTGVLSLVLVDGVIAAAYAGMIYSLAVLATAPVTWWLARLFAVT